MNLILGGEVFGNRELLVDSSLVHREYFALKLAAPLDRFIHLPPWVEIGESYKIIQEHGPKTAFGDQLSEFKALVNMNNIKARFRE